MEGKKKLLSAVFLVQIFFSVNNATQVDFSFVGFQTVRVKLIKLFVVG